MSYTDERIVKMTFDHEAFGKDIDATIKSLKELDNALIFKNSNYNTKAIDNLNSSLGETNTALEKVQESVQNVKVAFSTLQAIGIGVFAELGRSAVNFGKSVYANTLGQVISGGRQRAMNLEAAKFQLEGMNQEWDIIKGDIDYAVKDTAYGLDAAAKVASQLTASNVKVGDDMKNALRAISGVASMTSSSYEEIGQIFTTVASNNRLMTMQLRQLSAKGLNVSANMIKYFKDIEHMANVDEAAINDMVSKGKISFKEFAEAMDYAFGEHAKEANKTFTGALSNMKAALSRIGEMFETPRMEFFRNIYNDLIPVINFAKKMIAMFTNLYVLGLDKLQIWIHNLLQSEDLLYSIGHIIGGLYTWVRAIYVAAYQAGIKLPNLTKGIAALREATAGLVLEGERFNKVVAVLTAIFNLGSSIVVLFKSAFYAVEPLFNLVGSFLGVTIVDTDTLADRINKIAFILKACYVIGAKIIRLGIETIIARFVPVLKGLGIVIAGLFMILVEGFGYLKKGVLFVADIFKTLSDHGITFQSVLTAIGTKIVTFGGIISAVLGTSLNSFKGFFDFVGGGFTSLLKNLSKSSEETIKETDKAQTNIAEKTRTGIIGGGFLKGHAGGTSLVDKTKLLQQYTDAQTAAEEAEEKLAQDKKNRGMGAATVDEMEDVVAANNKLTKNVDVVTKMVKFLSDATSKIGKYVENPMNLLKAGGVLLGIAAISKIFIAITKTMAATKEATASAATSDLITSVSKVLWSIAGVIGVMGLVSNLVDMKNFKSIGATIVAVVVLFAVVIKALTTMSKVKTMAQAIEKLTNGLRATFAATGELKITVRQTVSSMAEMFKELALMIGVIMGSVIAITVLTTKFGFKIDDFIASAILISATVLGLLGGLSLIALAFKKINSNEKKIEMSLKGGEGLKRTKDVVESNIVTLIKTVTPLILTLTIAIAVLSKYDFKTVATAAAALVVGTLSILLGLMAVMEWFSTKIEGNKWVLSKDYLERMKTFDKEFMKLIFVVKGVFTTVAVSMKLIAGMSVKKMLVSAGVLIAAVGAVLGFAVAWFTFIGYMQRTMPKDVISDNKYKEMSKALYKTALSMSVLADAVATSLAIIGKIDSDNLVPAAVTFGIIMASMAGAMFLLMVGINKLVETVTIMNGLSGSASSLKTVLASVGILFAEIIVAIIVLSGAFVIIARAIEDMNAPASTILTSFAIVVGSLAALMLVMLAIIKMSTLISNISAVYSMIAVMFAIGTFMLGVAYAIKIMATIDWTAFTGSEKYLIGFGAAIFGLISLVVLAARFLSTCMSGIAGIVVVLMAIGTLGIMLAGAAYIFSMAIEKTTDAFIRITSVPWEQAKKSMTNMKDIVQMFIEAMSFSFKVLASALVFSLSMKMMGEGLTLLASLDAEALYQVVEMLKVIFSDIAGLSKLLIVCTGIAAMFWLLGTSLGLGAVGFLVFALLLPKIVESIIPAITKLVSAINEMGPVLATLGDSLSSEELNKILKGLAQIFLVGALLGISASTLAVSAIVFLAGAWVLQKAAAVFKVAIADFYTSLEYLSWDMTKRIIGDQLLLIVIGAEMGVAAGLLFLGALGLLAAGKLGVAAAKIMVKMFDTLYSAFEAIDIGKVTMGCAEVVAAATLIGIAAVILSLAGVPFIIAMTMFGIGIFILTANVAIFSLGIAALAWAFGMLADISSEQLDAAVNSIITFIFKLNEALEKANELIEDGAITAFADTLLKFSLSMLAISIVLPLSGLGLIIGGGLLWAAAKIFKAAFVEMTDAFAIFSSGTTMEFLDAMNYITYELGSFAGWFLLFNIPFAIGAAAFAASAWLLDKGVGIINAMVTKYNLKKVIKQIEPIRDIGTMFLDFSIQVSIGGVLLAGAAFVITMVAEMVISTMKTAIPVMDEFGEATVRLSENMQKSAESASESGKAITDGLVYGLTLGHPEVVDSISNLATDALDAFDSLLGIHSPATEMIWRGLMTMLGYEEGLEEGEDGCISQAKSSVSDIEDIFGSAGDWIANKLGVSGWNAGASMGENLKNALSPWLNSVIGDVGGAAGLIASILNLPSPTQLASKIQGYDASYNAAMSAGQTKKAEEYKTLADAARKEAAELGSPEGIMAKITEYIKEFFGDTSVGGGGGGSAPVYTGDTATPADFGNAGRSAGSSSGAREAKTAGSNVGTSIVNNNNYQFIQNNYSPEPIDRTELYTQTNNQLNTWYKWLGSQT